MNKKVLIGIIVAIVLVAAGAAYFFVQGSNNPDAAKTSQEDAAKNASGPQPKEEVRVSSIANFFTDGSTRECTYGTTVNGSTRKIVFYFDNNRAFTVISTESEGEKTTLYSLYKEGATYVWQEGVATGSKIVQTAEELKAQYEASMKAATEEGSAEAKEAAKNVVVTCKPWKADESKFGIPPSVKFNEINV